MTQPGGGTASDRPHDGQTDPAPDDAIPDDRSEGSLVRAHGWVIAHWPATSRRRAAYVLALSAIAAATLMVSFDVLRAFADVVRSVAYAGLFVACWIGAGGALLPIPGVRALSLLMVIQQAALLDPVTVIAVAAIAMTIGQSSWYFASRAAGNRRKPGAGTSPGAPAPNEPVVPDGAVATEAASATGSIPSGRRARMAARAASAQARVERGLRAHDMSTVFAASALPTPLTTFAATSSGAIRIPYSRFLTASFAGRLLLCSVLAIGGRVLLELIG
jgi:membrane protein DedA with SNARE-associated domain